jgi:hypothetical protein
MNPRIFALIVLLGRDYMCDFDMPFVISVALFSSWLITRAVGGLPAQLNPIKFT